jgi:hypothetical protein
MSLSAGKKTMIEMEVNRVQVSSRSYHRVILKEKDGDGSLHIVIGPTEARAISLAHNGQKPARPLSYDLVCSLLQESGSRIQQVSITDLQDGIYYAEVQLKNADNSTTALDSRPSDAIALALRANAPIFASEAVLQEEAEAAQDAAREEDELMLESEGEEEPTADGMSAAIADLMQRAKTSTDNPLSEVDQLKKRLDQAVSEEAFEEAALLRDLITELTQQGE